MEQDIVYRSPLILYKVSRRNNSYNIDVYLEGFKSSDNKNYHCEIKNFSADAEKAKTFARILSQNAALPIHIPELAEEFLSF